jgi:tetratricopeptide (TPR) repeat protein
MKLTAILVMVMATAAFAQTQPGNNAPAAQNQPAAQSGATQPPAAPAGKRPLQAKTQPEYEAYNAAHGQMNDAAAMEKAANDFATKFPDSELRVLLYRDAMHAYQRANNGEKMMAMAREVSKLDPDDPEAMVAIAEVLMETTKDSDLDRDQKLAEAAKLAQHALETVDTGMSIPAGNSPEQVDLFKRALRSSAYEIIGNTQYTKENFKDSEDSYRKSIDAFPARTDAVTVLRLALSLDKQGKYPEALKEANRAVDLFASDTNYANSPMVGYARQERDRLVSLNGGTPAAKPATGQAAPPKN